MSEHDQCPGCERPAILCDLLPLASERLFPACRARRVRARRAAPCLCGGEAGEHRPDCVNYRAAAGEVESNPTRDQLRQATFRRRLAAPRVVVQEHAR